MTNEEHNKYIAYAFIAHGVFQTLMTLFIAAIWAVILPIDDPGPPPAFFIILFGFLFVFQMIFAAPSFIASYALLKRKPWARIAAIVAAAMSAMNAPVGTAAAVYSLWFFCGEQWKLVYPETAAKGQEDHPELREAAEQEPENYTREEEGAYVYRTPPPPDWR